tara:strand:- start:451 stop:1371 length:921 start_codon:yes stop_codon:yes gene_type:complete
MNVCKYANCDVTDIIMKYLEPLMQICSATMTDYNMQMKTTKCLNTAVMLTNILGGSDKLKTVEYCEVSKINNRYEKKGNRLQHKLNIFKELKKDLENKKINKRYFYYILMTNNDMEKSDLLNNSSSSTQSFPGHVFIIDKFPNCNSNGPSYNVYQSYINQYDLKGHYKRNKNSMKVQNNDITFILNGISNIVSNPTWNNDAIKFWNDFTFVDTKNLLNYRTDKINLCYSKISIDDCYKEFYRFSYNKALNLYNELTINDTLNLNKYDIYANKNDFYVKQLKPKDLYLKLRELVIELENKIKSFQIV